LTKSTFLRGEYLESSLIFNEIHPQLYSN